VKSPIRILPHPGSMDDEVVTAYNEVPVFNSLEAFREMWIDNHNFMI
jgi:hypothetical protein